MTILDTPPKDWKRPGTPPLHVQVKVLLRQLGLYERELGFGERVKVNWDHRPPLSERRFDTDAWDTIPAANDPNFIEAIDEGTHDKRTNGPGGEKRITTLGSDTHNRKKVRNLIADQVEFVRTVLQRPCGQKRVRKGKIPSRPFQQRPKKARRPQREK